MRSGVRAGSPARPVPADGTARARSPVVLPAHNVERPVLDLVVDAPDGLPDHSSAISWTPPSSRIAIVIEPKPDRGAGDAQPDHHRDGDEGDAGAEHADIGRQLQRQREKEAIASSEKRSIRRSVYLVSPACRASRWY